MEYMHRLQAVDSTVIRAHHHAAGAKGGLRKRLGCSKGGLSTKIHLWVDSAGLPMRIEIVPAQVSDYTGYDLEMADYLPLPTVLVADWDYGSGPIREDIESRNALPMISMRKNRRVRKALDMTIYTLRNMVERVRPFS